MELFNKSIQYNLTSCPIETPFTVNFSKNCFDCPKGLFDLGQQKCIFCEQGKFINVTTSQCQQCKGELHFEKGIGKCVLCDAQGDGYFDTAKGKCSKCGKLEKLNDARNGCVKIECPFTKPRITENKTCEACPEGNSIDPTDPTKCIRTNYAGFCPPDQPYYDTKLHQCIPCPDNTFFNKSTYKCESGNFIDPSLLTPNICPLETPYYN